MTLLTYILAVLGGLAFTCWLIGLACVALDWGIRRLARWGVAACYHEPRARFKTKRTA